MQTRTALMTAGDPGETLTQIRTVTTPIITFIDTLAPFVEEGAAKSALMSAKTGITAALEALPKDGIGITAQSNAVIVNILSILSNAQETIKNVVATAQNAVTQSRTALAGLPAQVTAAVTAEIQSQIAAGKLVTKADHDTQVATAVSTAKTTADAAIATNLQRGTTRMNALATAGLPLPDNVILLGEDAAFDAWKTSVATRKTELEPFKLGADRMKALMSATPAAYADALALLKEVGPAKSASPFNPFLNSKKDAGNRIALALV
jgi:hypothetical protein